MNGDIYNKALLAFVEHLFVSIENISFYGRLLMCVLCSLRWKELSQVQVTVDSSVI